MNTNLEAGDSGYHDVPVLTFGWENCWSGLTTIPVVSWDTQTQ